MSEDWCNNFNGYETLYLHDKEDNNKVIAFDEQIDNCVRIQIGDWYKTSEFLLTDKQCKMLIDYLKIVTSINNA